MEAKTKHKAISREAVFQAAKDLFMQGKYPTLAEIRLQLGNRGSKTTIHKYFLQWRDNCVQKTLQENLHISQDSVKTIEKSVLEQVINKQAQQLALYSKELMRHEKNQLELSLENENLAQELFLLKQELKEAQAQKNSFEFAIQEIKAERQSIIEQEFQKKDILIQALREELKQLNQETRKEIIALARKDDDALMEGKIKIMNLNDELKSSHKKNKELNNHNYTLELANTKLSKKLKCYQKMAQEHLSEEIQIQYIPEEY